jgi:LytS/YehU family sensor histidine kinase
VLFPAAIAASALVRTPLAIWLQVHFFRPGSAAPDAVGVFGESFLNIFIWAVFTVAVQQVLEKIAARQYIAAMEKQRIRNELDFLKAQFNPHFLFNSINSIYGHIDRRNEKARGMLLSFSELLRYQLYECNVDKIVIEKEIQYIRNYVALQQERKEEDLRVELDIAEDVRGFMVAPLLLITFVENAFKYVSGCGDRPGAVLISLRRKGPGLLFRIYNTADERVGARGGGVGASGGIGIANARRRLDLQYPGAHVLTIADKGDSFEVILHLTVTSHVAQSNYSR